MKPNPWVGAICALCLAVAAHAGEVPTITLEQAFTRTLATHPDLRLSEWSLRKAQGLRQSADLMAPLRIEVSLENWAGTGSHAALRGVEATVGLSSVIERGGKRAARLALADAEIDAQAMQRFKTQMDLLAEVARRYVQWAAHEQEVAQAESEFRQRGRIVDEAQRRFRAGASPESIVLMAEVARSRSELDLQRARTLNLASARQLALMWGDVDMVVVPKVGTALLPLPAIASVESLRQRLQKTPELKRFADQRRISDAKQALARSDAKADFDWQIGVRRFEMENDWGLVASLSVPLGASARAQPALQVATAELESLADSERSTELVLTDLLLTAHAGFVSAQEEIEWADKQLLPRLQRAQDVAGAAFRRGALSFLEWGALQSEQAQVQRQRVASALSAHLALIEIQRLTADSALIESTSNPGNLR